MGYGCTGWVYDTESDAKRSHVIVVRCGVVCGAGGVDGCVCCVDFEAIVGERLVVSFAVQDGRYRSGPRLGWCQSDCLPTSLPPRAVRAPHPARREHTESARNSRQGRRAGNTSTRTGAHLNYISINISLISNFHQTKLPCCSIFVNGISIIMIYV